MAKSEASLATATVTMILTWIVLGVAGAPEWTFIAVFFIGVFIVWSMNSSEKSDSSD
jgi:hypothetical protein